MSSNKGFTQTQRLHPDDYPAVYEFYKDKLSKGVPITRIAHMYNEENNTNHAESTLRNRYERIEAGYIANERAEALVKRERQAAQKSLRADIKMREANNRLKYAQALMREYADKSTVVNIIREIFDEEYEGKMDTYASLKVKADEGKAKVFVMSDMHAGYFLAGEYDDKEFERRMGIFFKRVEEAIREEGLKEVNILELGDQVEGTTLRASQLYRITGMLGHQIRVYGNVFKQNLSQLAQRNPDVKINIGFVILDNHSEVRIHGAKSGDTDDRMAEVLAYNIYDYIENSKSNGNLKNVHFEMGADIRMEVEVPGKDVPIIIHAEHGQNLPNNLENASIKVNEFYDYYPHIIILGHYHQYKTLTRNVRDGFLTKVITAPAGVGRTDYSDKLKLSSHAGALELDVYSTHVDEKFIVLNADRVEA